MQATRQTDFTLAVALLPLAMAAVGCRRVAPAPPSAPPAVVANQDPVATLYANMQQADTKIDIATQDLEDGISEAKALAPKAGGDAKKALLNVASLMNSAGEDLAEYQDVPTTLDAFKKDFAAQDEHRLTSIDSAVQALKSIQAADYVLDDLSKNVPTESKSALDEIAGNCDEADNGLQVAIKAMGGKIPTEEDDIDTGTDAAESDQ